MDQEKEEKLLQKFSEWIKKEPVKDEDSFAVAAGDVILGLGYYGGYHAFMEEAKAVIAALESAETQMSQMEKSLSQDVEFIAVLAEVRASLEKGREIVQ
jgi:hypothetical protein